MNSMIKSSKLFALHVLLCVLVACESADPEMATESAVPSAPDTFTVRTLNEAEVFTSQELVDPQREIADILFEALQALDADRLLTPVDDNAHARFKKVLALQPGNEIALQGLQDIVLRYLALSEESSRRGLFAEAQTMLERARFVDETHPAIQAAETTLQNEMNSQDLFFQLDPAGIAQRSDAVKLELGDIARQARDRKAFFLITAPTDEQARWMFQVMREAVNGYRLRGNIELSSFTSIRLRLPKEAT